MKNKATWLITCGGPQSNHARATAFVARRLGLGVSLVIRKPKDGLAADSEQIANYLLNRILGAEIQLVEFSDYAARGSKYDSFLEEKARELKSRDEVPYIIPEGGSSELGCFGYLVAVEEMLASWSKICPGSRAPDSLFTALGSGGTFAGLHLGLEQQGLPATILHAVNVCDNASYFEQRIKNLFASMESHYQIKAGDGKASDLGWPCRIGIREGDR